MRWLWALPCVLSLALTAPCVAASPRGRDAAASACIPAAGRLQSAGRTLLSTPLRLGFDALQLVERANGGSNPKQVWRGDARYTQAYPGAETVKVDAWAYAGVNAAGHALKAAAARLRGRRLASAPLPGVTGERAAAALSRFGVGGQGGTLLQVRAVWRYDNVVVAVTMATQWNDANDPGGFSREALRLLSRQLRRLQVDMAAPERQFHAGCAVRA